MSFPVHVIAKLLLYMSSCIAVFSWLYDVETESLIKFCVVQIRCYGVVLSRLVVLVLSCCCEFTRPSR